MTAPPARVPVAERLMRLETLGEGTQAALARGSENFVRLQRSIDDNAAEARREMAELKTLVVRTHAACLKAEDLTACEKRVAALEAFRERVKRWTGVGGVIGGGVSACIAFFGPERVAQAWERLWG